MSNDTQETDKRNSEPKPSDGFGRYMSYALNHHAAERLLKIAQDIRLDIDRLGRLPH
jgi:hypothetical protein